MWSGKCVCALCGRLHGIVQPCGLCAVYNWMALPRGSTARNSARQSQHGCAGVAGDQCSLHLLRHLRPPPAFPAPAGHGCEQHGLFRDISAAHHIHQPRQIPGGPRQGQDVPGLYACLSLAVHDSCALCQLWLKLLAHHGSLTLNKA